ncbi:hypothetical protein [Pseudomonas fulva]|uniref:hypothetical protein n=1 Tax=Pseudomonas fulva TaxID=47880 RepID=UPI0018A8F72E|nr:hypothetical protein [Pseudomonas fulva]MBF8775628.1 hypothetical protein [Pseudomonas fulva]
MNIKSIPLSRLKDEAAAMSNAGYFVDSLAKFIGKVGADDPQICEEALDGYVVGGLMAGLRMIGADLMCRAEEFNTLIDKAEQPAAKRG